jgi:oxalate decarboxylase/phosphoglucose isomerase-like protein (cupin superfamily)
VVPLTGGKLRLVGDEPGEPVTAELEAGHPYFRRAGVEHDVINAGDAEVVFMELELK